MDQAQKLRDIIGTTKKKSQPVEETPSSAEKHQAKVITISSGKGGVGKTNFTVNLALALAKMDRRVSIIDADLGLSNVDVILGIVPKLTLLDVIRAEKDIEEIMIEGPHGIRVVSGGSGVKDLVDLSPDQINHLIESFEVMNDLSDYILIDTGAGISNAVMSFLHAADDIIIVVTPDPTSITDAYALIKNIMGSEKSIKVVVNRVESNKEGGEVFNKINTAAKKFLDKELENLGYIYEDGNVKKSVRSQKPFVIGYPNSLAAKGVDLIAYNLEHNNKYVARFNSFNKFINGLFGNL